MQQLPKSQYRIRFGLRGWAAVVLGLATFMAVAAFLTIGFLFVVLPMIVLAPVIYHFLPKKSVYVVATPDSMERTAQKSDRAIIDGDYRVIEAKAGGEKSQAAEEA